jgi:sarcosine oxidase
VIVAGLGAVGSATCRELAARGLSVIGFDRYTPPHEYGSTHGDTRITRLAIGEGPEYVPLVHRSHELWRALESATGATLLTEAGCLIMGHGSSPFLAQTRAAARECGIRHERLGTADLRRRFPMFAVDDETEGYYEPGAGYVRPEAAVRIQLGLARSLGAELRFAETVKAWCAGANGVAVSTDAGTYVADQLVLSVGPWIRELFPDGRSIFAVYRQLLHWFAIRDRYEQLRDMPTFVWDVGGQTSGFVHLLGFYGFPAIDGPDGGVKLATEQYEHTTAPDGRRHPATPEEIAEMYESCVAPYLPWLGPASVRTVSCLYTSTRGSRFVIDRHPQHDEVVIVSACSGHGFKHSPAIGEAVSDSITGRAPRVDLSPFRLPG